MELAIMIEGQNGLNWTRWQRIARAVEDLGFAGLYRSDHFTNAGPPDLDSLELWISLTWLAANTRRIEFGPLVTPLSFRDPVMTARMAGAVDDLSGGRLVLGLGAGWQAREHAAFGYELLPPAKRLKRFREGMEVVTRLLRSSAPSSFAGEYYRLQDAVLLPHPARPNRPPVLIGGGKAVLPYVARYADEWNVAFATPQGFAQLNEKLDVALRDAGRKPEEVRRSLMTGLIFGCDQVEVDRKVTARNLSQDDLSSRGLIVGTPAQIVDQLDQLARVGVQRVMLQWLNLDDLDGLASLAKGVLPALK
ncbi:MAG: LLM class F420-dependent oxidoreductase [Chloroflexi bacterium]|nr:LLM class F420-dependent oxidoreductase [Chloroflexota bacterium]